jgi:hypothetical protein
MTLRYALSAVTLQAAVGGPLAFWPTLLVQVSSSFVGLCLLLIHPVAMALAESGAGERPAVLGWPSAATLPQTRAVMLPAAQAGDGHSEA